MNTDMFPTRVVVIALAIVVVGGLGALVFLASTSTAIPDSLDRMVFAALGALSALLAKTTSAGDTQDVKVVDSEHDPVAVQLER